MKLIVLKTNLKEGLASVERSVGEASKLPILKNVLLRAQDNKLKISATNLELGTEKIVSSKVTENGSITVPLTTFSSIVNNSDNERINLEVKDNNLIFKTDNYEARIQGIKEEEFPIIPKIDNKDGYLEVDASVFKNAISKIITAVQISEIRPEISGVLFDFQVTILKLVATDSFRLAEKTLSERDYKTNFNRGFKIIVPLRTIQEVVRIFRDDQKIQIHVDPNQILFKNEDLELISRLIDGNYPDYEQIIPKNFDTEVTLNRDYFINAVKLVSNFSGKVSDIRLKLNKNLEVYSANQYLGENSYLVPAKVTGTEFENVSFNWRYLLDGIKTVDNENLVFGVNGDSRPAIIKSPKDDSYFYIVMPIKV